MAIKTKYNFKGLNIPNATIKIIRVFGSSSVGWNSLVGVYTTTIEEVPATEATEFIPATEATTKEVLNLIDTFNFHVPFSETQRGYIGLYEALMLQFGGIRV